MQKLELVYFCILFFVPIFSLDVQKYHLCLKAEASLFCAFTEEPKNCLTQQVFSIIYSH